MARDKREPKQRPQPQRNEQRGREGEEQGGSRDVVRLPLYREAQMEIHGSIPVEANAGLWYDKFCCTWRVSFSAGQNGRQVSYWSLEATDRRNPKLDWIHTLTGHSLGDQALLEELKKRVLALVAAKGGRFWVYRTEGRLVTGMGRTNPVENGLAFHHTLGLPYLPGSSLKGLLRAYAMEDAASPENEGKDLQARINRLFGDEEAKTVGALCFLDVLPAGQLRLEADVMTPHYANWTAEDEPGDWRSPTPIPFLTVGAGNKFLVAILPRHNGRDESSSRSVSDEDWQLIERWLESALAEFGAGAKTAVGYGRMVPDPGETNKLRNLLEEEEQKREGQARLEAMDPLEGQLEQLAQQAQKQGMKPYVLWLKKLNEGQWPDKATQRKVAQRIKEVMEKEGAWKPTTAAKKPEKDRDHQRTREVMRFLEG